MDNSSEILDQLDGCAKKLNFPLPNNVNYPSTDMRLTVFLNSSEWLILFEMISFSVPLASFDNLVYAYGNKLEKLGLQSGKQIIEEAPDALLWDDDMNFILDLLKFKIIVDGETREFSISPDDYQQIGIELNSNVLIPELKFLTFLSSHLTDLVFMKDEELLAICNRENLHKFIQLDAWQHPNVAKGELPSQSLCFQNIVQAIAENDASLYFCPQELINTHWSNWDFN